MDDPYRPSAHRLSDASEVAAPTGARKLGFLVAIGLSCALCVASCFATVNVMRGIPNFDEMYTHVSAESPVMNVIFRANSHLILVCSIIATAMALYVSIRGGRSHARWAVPLLTALALVAVTVSAMISIVSPFAEFHTQTP